MDKKNEIRRIWTESFNDTPEFIDLFFTRIYTDAHAMTLEENGQTVSSLMLRQYPFLYHGIETTAAYIYGAATRRQARGRGFMSRLMEQALRTARSRGDTICTLIPAHPWLYFFYDRFGFSTVFYTDTQRFTSLHAFSGEGAYMPVDSPDAPGVYEAFSTFEKQRGCGILHTPAEFRNIIDDMTLEAGTRFVAMADESGNIASMAFARTDGDTLEVRELLGTDNNARTAAMRRLRSLFPDMPVRLLAPPAHSDARRLHSRGMGRIINVPALLGICAKAHPQWKCTLRVTDALLPENSGTYRVENGTVTTDVSFRGVPDLDVTVEVLNAIAFSDSETGSILGFPSQRAHMSLMLD